MSRPSLGMKLKCGRSTTRGDSYLNQSELLLERIDKDIFEILLHGTHGLIVFIIFSQTHLIGKFDFESKSIRF